MNVWNLTKGNAKGKKIKAYSATVSCPSTRVNLPRKTPYLHAHVCQNL